MHYDFVIFLDVDWELPGVRNRQHFLIAEVARQLEGRSNVLGVERPICPWTGPFGKREKLFQWLRRERGLRKVSSNLCIYTPFVLVHNLIAARIPGLTSLNRRVLRALLRRTLRQMGCHTDNLIAWIHHPYQLEDVGLVTEKLLVYDCYDDYFARSEGRRLADLRRRERAILARADLVLVASDPLLAVMQGRARRVQLLPNGVDVDLFSQAMCPETRIPVEMASLPHPIIGFVGKITPRLDFDLLLRLATRHPDWSFVLIGPEEDRDALRGQRGYTDLRNASNAHLLGPRPYEAVPGYLKGCDVCFIPYTLNQFNLGSSPLKLYEYLAAGNPIVSTDLPGVRAFEGLVRIATSAEEFERAITVCLSEDGDRLRRRRLAAAQQNSWEKRAERVLELIELSVPKTVQGPPATRPACAASAP